MEPEAAELCSVCRRARPDVLNLYPADARMCPVCAEVLRGAFREKPPLIERVWPDRTGWRFSEATRALEAEHVGDGPGHADLAWECLEAGMVDEAFDEAALAVSFFREPAALAEAIAVLIDPRVAPKDVLDRLRAALYPA